MTHDPYAETDVWPLPRYSGDSKVAATFHPAAQITPLPAPESTESAPERSEAPEAVPTPEGAREALVEQLAEAIAVGKANAALTGENPLGELLDVVEAHAAAQVEAAVSVVRAEVERHKDALFERGERWKRRAEAAESALTRVRALGDSFADDGLGRHGGNVAWHIEEAIANEKGDLPDAADLRIASQRERAEAAASERDALREKVTRVKALIEPGQTPDGEPLPEWVHVDDLRAALSDLNTSDQTGGE